MKPITASVFLSVLLTITAWSAEAPTPKQPSDGPPMRFEEVATGTWGVDYEGATCSENPHTLSFADDGSTMNLRYAHGVDGNPPLEATYRILAEGPGYKRMQIVGETRKTDAGEPVVWDLVLLSADSYCWHRTDWQGGGCTKPATRCRQRPDA